MLSRLPLLVWTCSIQFAENRSCSFWGETQRTKRRDLCFALCACPGWHINYFTLCTHIKYCTLSNLTHCLMFGVHLIHCHAKKSLHVTDFSTEYYVGIKWKLNFHWMSLQSMQLQREWYT